MTCVIAYTNSQLASLGLHARTKVKGPSHNLAPVMQWRRDSVIPHYADIVLESLWGIIPIYDYLSHVVRRSVGVLKKYEKNGRCGLKAENVNFSKMYYKKSFG